jgi:hypothetical protein
MVRVDGRNDGGMDGLLAGPGIEFGTNLGVAVRAIHPTGALRDAGR